MDRSRKGYECCYEFRMEDEILPLYKPWLYIIERIDGLQIYLFEIRTNFKLKKVDDDGDGQIISMGSERFGASVQEDEDDGEGWLAGQLSFRLKDDYWMSDDEIRSLFRKGLDFAKQTAVGAAAVAVIPVVVGLDVWTVQQEGEPISAAIDRAIRPECLIPLYLWWTHIPKGSMQFDETPYLNRKSFLELLERVRVEDEAGLAIMEVCPVCSRNSVIGAQISFLPCNHACHSHCVFEWLRKGNSSCPTCGVRIPAAWE